jgi:hypothetical protein
MDQNPYQSPKEAGGGVEPPLPGLDESYRLPVLIGTLLVLVAVIAVVWLFA